MKTNNSKDPKCDNNGKVASSNKKSQRKPKPQRQQPRKDSGSKRVNYDNTREDKFLKDTRDVKYQDRPGKGYTKPETSKADNDISWYSKNPELVKAAGSLPFASINGTKLNWDNQLSLPLTRVPGVMSFGFTPSIGGSDSEYYAITQAARSTYSYLVHANSRNYTYEDTDLMIAILAGSQVFAIVSSVIRAYGIAKLYDEPNLYKPDVVLSAMGFDPQNFRRNLGQIWFDLNEIINRTKQIWIPNTMPILMRWFWMNGNVFMDATDPKSQIYMYVQNTYWQYDATAFTTGGALVPTTLNLPVGGEVNNAPFTPAEKTYTWDQWLNVINSMIDALLDDEDRGIMYGDILNAYGADHIYALPSITSEYTLAYNYSEEVLSQFENLTVSRVGQMGIYQANQNIYPIWGDTSTFKLPTYSTPGTQLINFHFPNQPRPEDIMVATRCKSMGLKFNTGTEHWTAVWNNNEAELKYQFKQQAGWETYLCGTEIVTSCTIFEYTKYDAASGENGYRMVSYMVTSAGAGKQPLDNEWPFLWALSAFDWHPFYYATDTFSATGQTGSDLKMDTSGAMGDYCNYTIITLQELKKLHDTAIYSEFGVPQM